VYALVDVGSNPVAVGIAFVLFRLERRGPHPAGPRHGLVIDCEYRGRWHGCLGGASGGSGYLAPVQPRSVPADPARPLRAAPRRSEVRLTHRKSEHDEDDADSYRHCSHAKRDHRGEQ
jgi:hypothetical protein